MIKEVNLVADLQYMEDTLRPNQKVVFRASIDETEPETVFISITRDRWENEFNRVTKIPLVLFPGFDPESEHKHLLDELES